MENMIRSILAALAMVFAAGTALAGNLDAPAAPTDPGSAMYTGADIYSRLTTGAAGVKRSGPFI
jgi:type IV secretory pathway TrbL component